MNSTGILMFVKYPEEGKVKTRLAKDIGDQKARQIYSAFVQACLKNYNIENTELTIYFSPAERKEDFKNWLGEDHQYLAQCEGDLSDRLKFGFSKMFDQYKKVIAIGTDSPDLPVSYVNKAVMALTSYDCVIGPCEDGGYYLIGLSIFKPEVFFNIDWSTEKVYTQTLNQIKMNNLICYKLPSWYDVDTVEELNKYKTKNNIDF